MESFKRNYVSQSRMNGINSMDEVKYGLILCYLKVCLLIGEHLLTTKEKCPRLNDVAKHLDVAFNLISDELYDSSKEGKNAGSNDLRD